MVVPSGEPVPLDELIHPRAEPEIAFLLGRRDRARRRPPACSPRRRPSSPPSRWSTPATPSAFRLPDSVADNAGAARVVLGTRPRRPAELVRPAAAGLRVPLPRRVIDTAAGGAVMGHPAAAVAWLVKALADAGRAPRGRERRAVRRPHGLGGAAPGAIVTAEFDGLGSVEVHM